MEFATIVDCDTDGENERDKCIQDGTRSVAEEKSNGGREAAGPYNGIRHQQNRRRLSAAKLLVIKRCACRSVVALLLLVLIVIGTIVIVRHLMSQKCDVTAVTSIGKLLGCIVEAPQGGYVEEYLGVPFAHPPVGHLRFADPLPLEQFPTDPYPALKMGNSCIQPLDLVFGNFSGSTMWNAPNTQSEDCLYMNIWVPHPRQQKRSVMIWIYGGGFYSGSNALAVYDGKALAAHGDVIVVSINYRVGAFGFLSTGDGRIKGNFGLMDQVVALEWVAKNIEAFGGDPNSVTLFGESSGASSVGLHMMSPRTQHLFTRAIFESGSPDCHWAILSKEMAAQRSRLLFDELGCSNSENLLEFLRDLPADRVLAKEWVDSRFLAFPWTPTIDGVIVPENPRTLLHSGRFARKDALLGINENEGSYWVIYALPGFSKDGPGLQNRTSFEQGVDTICWDMSASARMRVNHLYAPEKETNYAGYRDALFNICGDKSFVCPTLELNDALVKADCKTYLYHLTYRASNEVWPSWMGVIHGAEIQWIFGMPLNKSLGYNDEEKKFSKAIMSYWANFAKTGDPNDSGLPQWPAYSPAKKQYLDLEHTTKFSVKTSLRQAYCDFWKQ